MKRWQLILVFIVILVVAILFVSPFYFVVVNSVKSYGAIIKNAAALPSALRLDNFARAWKQITFPRALLNSVLVTSFSLLGMVAFGSVAAWRMVRRPHRASRLIFMVFVSAMVVPFQSVMIPMMKVASTLHLLNSIPGIVIIYLGFGMPFSIFLFHGFSRSIPKELEESAYIDGCSTLQTFVRVVFPLLQSVVVTVVILQTLWLWNDFLLPLLVLGRKELRTIPLAIFSFFGQYQDRWDYALATLLMGMVPIIVFFLSLQKYIIRGVTAGAVKG